MDVDIIKRIREFKPTESYLLTYGIDLQYYEGVLLSELQRLGCNKNIVVSDGNQFHAELEASSRYINRLGREYMLFPTYIAQSFHPKVYLFKRTKGDATKLLSFIGSGNLTYPGLNTNYELFIDLEWVGVGLAPLYWQSIIQYFQDVLDIHKGVSADLARGWLNKGFPSSFEKEQGKLNFELIKYPSSESIFMQFNSKIGRDQVRKLLIMAPFYDHDLSALKMMLDECAPKEIEIVLQPTTVNVPYNILKQVVAKRKNVKLLSFESKKGREHYLHAKLVLAETKKTEHVLMGSANVSDVALFGKGKFGNFEACMYAEFPKNYLIERLDIYDRTKEVSVNDLSIKSFNVDQMLHAVSLGKRILSAELNLGQLCFVLDCESSVREVDIELLFSDGKKVGVLAKRKDKEFFFYEGERLTQVLSARIVNKSKGEENKWVPVIYLDDIKKSTNRLFDKADKIRPYFITATDDEVQFHYLNAIVDCLIEDAVKNTEESIKKIKSVQLANGGRSEKEEAEVLISLDGKIKKKRSLSQDDYAGGFIDGFDFIISAFRDRKRPALDESVDVDPEPEILPSEGSAQEEVEIEIDSIEIISRKFRARRRTFINNDSVHDVFPRLCFFTIVALPHIPKLSKFFLDESGDRHPCIEGKDWDNFIIDSIDTIGQIMFLKENSNADIWPMIDMDIYRVDLFNLCVASIIYCCSTVYAFIKRDAEVFDDSAAQYCFALNKFLIVCAGLLRTALIISKDNMVSIKEKLKEVSSYFPCPWVTSPPIEEFLLKVHEYAEFDFKHAPKGGWGSLTWDSKRKFVVVTRGYVKPLWPEPTNK